jgi:hypothetical protein
VTLLAESEQTAPNSTDAAIASANGSGTLPKQRQIRISRPGPDASVSTLLGRGQRPPAWVERLVLEEVPTKDDYGLISLDALARFAQACSTLPNQTPKPYYGVGDDATIGVEWDLGRFHVEIQVGNNPAVDSIVFEVDKGEPEELPLQGNVPILAALMSRILHDLTGASGRRVSRDS